MKGEHNMGYERVFFWFFAIVAGAAFLSVVLKLRWYSSWLGRWFFVLTGDIALISMWIFVASQGYIPVEALPVYRAFVFGSLGLVFVWFIVDVWVKNFRFWAWTKEE